MGLNYTGPFFFSVVTTTVLHDLQVTESADVELWIQRTWESGGLTISYMQIF